MKWWKEDAHAYNRSTRHNWILAGFGFRKWIMEFWTSPHILSMGLADFGYASGQSCMETCQKSQTESPPLCGLKNHFYPCIASTDDAANGYHVQYSTQKARAPLLYLLFSWLWSWKGLFINLSIIITLKWLRAETFILNEPFETGFLMVGF